MWLVQYYPFIHQVALNLSIAVVGIVISFLLLALITRVWLDRRDRTQKALYEKWLNRFRACAQGSSPDENAVESIRSLHRRTQQIVFRAWLTAYRETSNHNVDNLRDYARVLEFPAVSLKHFRNGSTQDQITVSNIACRLRMENAEEPLNKLLESDNNYTHLAALEALIRIDIDEYFDDLIDYIISNPDMNFHFATRPLKRLQDIDYSERLVQNLKDQSLEDQEWVLRLLEYADCEEHRDFTIGLLNDSHNPEILSSLLRLIQLCEFQSVHDRVVELLNHNVWFVQVQAAITLRFIGKREDIELLEPLLGHPKWWVRYRSAQSIHSLADDDSNTIETLLNTVEDRYARDILKQVQSE